MSTEITDQNNIKEDQTESDSASDSGSESEYEEFDLSDNKYYQVLAAFFEDDEGNNICDHIAKLTETIDLNSKKLDKVLETLSNSNKKQIKSVKKSS